MPVSKHEEAEQIIRKEPITDCYEIGGELGRGKFAVVKRCVDRTTGGCYAAKYLRKNRRSGSGRADIMKEIDIMRLTKDQPRIIQMREVFESQREMIIVLELAAGGELFRRIAEDPLSEDDTRRVVRQILEGVVYLHEKEIIHMDLKPENILLCSKGALELKVADFGLSIQLQPGEMLRNLVGTAEYVAPEILNYEPVSCASDMWSVGALTYALMAGYSPFQGETNQETFLNVSMVDYSFDDEIFDRVSDMSKDFIEKLLIKTPKRRITARECLAHPWMCDVIMPQPIRSHYESSTSVDSSISLSMDNMVSSSETSPISSTTSSFAAGQSSYDTSFSTTLEECMAVGEGKDSGLGHTMSPSQLSSSLSQGLGAALVSSARPNTSFDGTSTQSRTSSSDWLGRQRELSSSPSWGEQLGRSPSVESTASGNGAVLGELAPVKQVSASSKQDDDASTPVVEMGGRPPSTPVVEMGDRPPSTPVVEMGDRPPSTPVVEMGDRPPSTPVVEMGGRPPSTPVVEMGGRPPSTPVVEMGDRPPSTPVVEMGDRPPSTPVVEMGDRLPSSHRERVSTEEESTGDSLSQSQAEDTPQAGKATESRPAARREKEVSPEVNKADEVMLLLRDGMSFSNGSKGSRTSVTNVSSSSRIEHRRLYTSSSVGTFTGQRSVPSASLQASLSPLRDAFLSRSSPAGQQQEMSEVMRLLTEGVPLTDGEKGVEREKATLTNRGESRNAEKPVETNVLPRLRGGVTPESFLRQQKSDSSVSVLARPKLSPQRRRIGKQSRPDSFILPLEVQEAILKGDLELAKIEETEEGGCPSTKTQSKDPGTVTTKQHRTAWN